MVGGRQHPLWQRNERTAEQLEGQRQHGAKVKPQNGEDDYDQDDDGDDYHGGCKCECTCGRRRSRSSLNYYHHFGQRRQHLPKQHRQPPLMLFNENNTQFDNINNNHAGRHDGDLPSSSSPAPPPRPFAASNGQQMALHGNEPTTIEVPTGKNISLDCRSGRRHRRQLTPSLDWIKVSDYDDSTTSAANAIRQDNLKFFTVLDGNDKRTANDNNNNINDEVCYNDDFAASKETTSGDASGHRPPTSPVANTVADGFRGVVLNGRQPTGRRPVSPLHRQLGYHSQQVHLRAPQQAQRLALASSDANLFGWREDIRPTWRPIAGCSLLPLRRQWRPMPTLHRTEVARAGEGRQVRLTPCRSPGLSTRTTRMTPTHTDDCWPCSLRVFIRLPQESRQIVIERRPEVTYARETLNCNQINLNNQKNNNNDSNQQQQQQQLCRHN